MRQFHWMGPLREQAEKKEGGDGGGGFDSKALARELVAALSPALGETLSRSLADALKAAQPKADETKADDGDDADGDKGKGNPDAKLTQLQRELKAMREEAAKEKTAREAAEKAGEQKDRYSRVRSALGDFQFASEAARESAYRLFREEAKRVGDDIFGPDGETPLGDYIRTSLEQTHDYLLKPRDVGGAGASGGGGTRTPAVGIETIRNGMTAEERQAVLNQIAGLAKS